jgi:hypothetical protein
MVITSSARDASINVRNYCTRRLTPLGNKDAFSASRALSIHRKTKPVFEEPAPKV